MPPLSIHVKYIAYCPICPERKWWDSKYRRDRWAEAHWEYTRHNVQTGTGKPATATPIER